MKFVHPDVLWGLSLLAIPIIIHLVNLRRRRTLVFTNVAFLKKVDQSTKAKNKVRDWLILLMRLLALSMLVIAFARPYLPISSSSHPSKDRGTAIFINNGFGLEGQSNLGTLLDDAKQMAIALIDSRESNRQYFLSTNTQSFNQRHPLQPAQIIDAIEQVDIDGKSPTLSEVVNRQVLKLSQEGHSDKEIVVFSDFQSDFFDPSRINPDSNLHLVLVPLRAESGSNLSIDSAYLDRTSLLINGENRLTVRLSNRGTQNRTTVFTLKVDGATKTRFDLALEGNQSIDTSLTLFGAPVDQRVEIEIEDLAQPFDNKYYGVIRPQGKRKIVVLGDDGKTAIDSVYAVEPLFDLVRINPKAGQVSDLKLADVIVIDELEELSSGWRAEIIEQTRSGASLVVIPSTDNLTDINALLQVYNQSQLIPADTMRKTGSTIAYDHRFFDGVFEKQVDLPHLPFSNRLHTLSTNNGLGLIETSTEAMVSLIEDVDHTVFVFHSSIRQHSDWGRSDMLLPMLFRMAWYQENDSKFAFEIGSPEILRFDSIAENYGFNDPDGQRLAPYRRGKKNELILGEEFEIPGFYQSEGLTGVSVIAYNYPRSNSDAYTLSNDALSRELNMYNIPHYIYEGDLADFSDSDITESFGNELWRWFMLSALLFVLFEILLLRSLKL